MGDKCTWVSTNSRLPPIATPSITQPDRLPTFKELSNSILQFSPYSRPQMHTIKKPRIRPNSRGQQSVAARLTPSSPLAQSFDMRDSPDRSVVMDTGVSLSRDEDLRGPVTVDTEQTNGQSSNGTLADEDGKGKTDPAMLSPPLSSPSSSVPSTHSYYDAPEVQTNYQGTTTFPVALNPSLPRCVHEYVSRMTPDDLEHQRFDGALQDIYRMSGIMVDPISLKRTVLLNAKQRMEDAWAEDPSIPLGDDSLSAYQRRLMVNDIDNQLRLLDVPR